jgi:hypothetical protein
LFSKPMVTPYEITQKAPFSSPRNTNMMNACGTTRVGTATFKIRLRLP